MEEWFIGQKYTVMTALALSLKSFTGNRMQKHHVFCTFDRNAKNGKVTDDVRYGREQRIGAADFVAFLRVVEMHPQVHEAARRSTKISYFR